jgi:leucyl aminopeptidase
MKYSPRSSNPLNQRTGCLVLGVQAGRKLAGPATELDELSGGYLSGALKRTAMEGNRGESLLLIDVPKARAERLLLIGCGTGPEIEPRNFCKIAAETARKLASTGAEDAISCLSLLPVKRRDTRWKVRQLVEANENRRYRFARLKRKDKPERADRVPKPSKIALVVGARTEVSSVRQACAEAVAIGAGVMLARDLGNLPSNICTPTYLAEEAKGLAKRHRSLQTTVLAEAEMKKLGMGALLSVTQGSHQPARLIIVEHRQGPKKQKPVVLVGKGVTFDTGGISLKPAKTLDEMKFDMCGAASVLGTIKACALLDLPINVIGVIAAVENMPGGGAAKPGDVVTSMSGRTVEILDTDAEGRLILCDALTYAQRYRPEAVIDIATLTGACVVALGKHPHGLFSNSRGLTDALVRAGRRSHDRPWPMPLWEEYQDELDSNFADMANVGGREAGAVTAACFLSRFTRRLRWAHLDVAGTAWRRGKSKGATGRPVPLLTQFLLDHATAKS